MLIELPKWVSTACCEEFLTVTALIYESLVKRRVREQSINQ